MKKLGLRQRLLIGGLTLAGAIWALDSFTGAATPQHARAGATPSSDALPTVNWHDITPTVEGLTRVTYDSVTPRLRQLQRDLFQPSAALRRLAEPPQETALPAAEPVATAAEQAASFVDAHELHGVLTGRRPVAVINDTPLALGGEIDGHVLVEVQRTQVLLQRLSDGARVRLSLMPPGDRPAP